MRHVFLIGSNGIPASYGGFETFVEQLTDWFQASKAIKQNYFREEKMLAKALKQMRFLKMV